MRGKGEERARLPRGGTRRAAFALETALLLATLALDLIGVLASAPAWYTAGKHVGGTGVVVGVVAVLLGLAGYRGTGPPGSAARRAARRRLTGSLCALLPFALAYWIRGGAGVPPDPPILWLEGLGVACLLFGEARARAAAYRGRTLAPED